MTTVEVIVERVALYLSNKEGRTVRQKHVAESLSVSENSLSVAKTREAISAPLMFAIIAFCAKERISINQLLFDQAPDSLQKIRFPRAIE